MRSLAEPLRFAPLLAGLLLCGCSDRDVGQSVFQLNSVVVRRYELDLDEPFTARQRADIQQSLERLFGTPDEPALPDEETIRSIIDPDLLQLAAGPVMDTGAGNAATSNGAGQGTGDKSTRGLYRQHCAHCHGITGDGAGPVAGWMNPYPRDFRPAVFQYKSTPLGRRPTDEDLRRIVTLGAPGTAMPAFNHLPEREIDALVAYAKYLSIRGETELALIDLSSDLDTDDEERLDTSDEFLVEEIVAGLAWMWAASEEKVVDVPPRPEIDFATSAELGRDIYFSETGGCVKCHGPTGLGDGQDEYYDHWSEQLEPSKPARVRQYVALGALPPRKIVPHNLRSGVYRGGRRPVDLYRRILNGIDGTPMPAASMKAAGTSDDAVGLTSDDVWHLVDYVRSLPYEPVSQSARPLGSSLLANTATERAALLAAVTVRQFDWQVQYPGRDGQLNTLDDIYAINELRVPLGEESLVMFLSGDVRHQIRLPEWNVGRTLVLGTAEVLHLTPAETGVFPILRDGRIGRGHPPVEARIVVESRNQWQEAIRKLEQAPP